MEENQDNIDLNQFKSNDSLDSDQHNNTPAQITQQQENGKKDSDQVFLDENEIKKVQSGPVTPKKKVSIIDNPIKNNNNNEQQLNQIQELSQEQLGQNTERLNDIADSQLTNSYKPPQIPNLSTTQLDETNQSLSQMPISMSQLQDESGIKLENIKNSKKYQQFLDGNNLIDSSLIQSQNQTQRQSKTSKDLRGVSQDTLNEQELKQSLEQYKNLYMNEIEKNNKLAQENGKIKDKLIEQNREILNYKNELNHIQERSGQQMSTNSQSKSDKEGILDYKLQEELRNNQLLREDLDKLRTRLIQEMNEKNQMDAELKEKEFIIEELSTQNNENQNMLTNKNEEFRKMYLLNENYTIEIQKLNQKIKSMIEKNDHYEQILKQANENIEEFLKEKQQLKEKLRSFQKENNRLQLQLQQIQKQQISKDQKIEQISNELFSTKKDLVQLNDFSHSQQNFRKTFYNQNSNNQNANYTTPINQQPNSFIQSPQQQALNLSDIQPKDMSQIQHNIEQVQESINAQKLENQFLNERIEQLENLNSGSKIQRFPTNPNSRHTSKQDIYAFNTQGNNNITTQMNSGRFLNNNSNNNNIDSNNISHISNNIEKQDKSYDKKLEKKSGSQKNLLSHQQQQQQQFQQQLQLQKKQQQQQQQQQKQNDTFSQKKHFLQSNAMMISPNNGMKSYNYPSSQQQQQSSQKQIKQNLAVKTSPKQQQFQQQKYNNTPIQNNYFSNNSNIGNNTNIGQQEPILTNKMIRGASSQRLFQHTQQQTKNKVQGNEQYADKNAIIPLDNELTSLQLEKKILENDLRKIEEMKYRSINNIQRKFDLEQSLQKIDTRIQQVRFEIRKYQQAQNPY